MTRGEWTTCAEPYRMFRFLRDLRSGTWTGDKVVDGYRRLVLRGRKIRLFAVACCDRILDAMDDEQVGLSAIRAAERFADKPTTRREQIRHRWHRRALRSMHEAGEHYGHYAMEAAAWATRLDDHLWNRERQFVADSAAQAAGMYAGTRRWTAVQNAETAAQCVLFRHVFGDPFAPAMKASPQDGDTVRLAKALYAGEDCHFALHDALLDTGHPELAEHFDSPEHPKGCWALDLILGHEDAPPSFSAVRWKTKEGRVLAIGKMDDRHLANTVRFVRRYLAERAAGANEHDYGMQHEPTYMALVAEAAHRGLEIEQPCR